MHHILIVEDEEHLAVGIKYNLEAEGYRVTVTGDGPTALAMLETDPQDVDLLILDLMLPGMSGYRVCETLRADGNEMPVLMLSARTLAEDRKRGFDVGADQYLMKPFDLDELISRVRNLLMRHARRGGASTVSDSYKSDANKSDNDKIVRFGESEVNFDTFEATVAGKPLRLTHMEIKLLRYLIENEGRVISREELLEQVWGFSVTPTTRTVDNFVLRLRKYFEQDPANPKHFLSVRGAGYRFVSEDGAK